MYEIMNADEAIRLIRDGDCICVNSFVGIENPTELHEALYRRYQKMQSPTHLTIVSSAGFGVWDDEHNAEGYIREGAVILRCVIKRGRFYTKLLFLSQREKSLGLSVIMEPEKPRFPALCAGFIKTVKVSSFGMVSR